MTIANTLSFLQNSAGALTTGTINANGAPVTVSISGSEKIRVDTNGYLLVNYSSSVGTYHLQVQGNGYFSGNLTAANLTVGSLTGSITTATNLAGGAAGQIPYQINSGVTGFVGPGTAGQILVSAGSAIPVYRNTATLTTLSVGAAWTGGATGEIRASNEITAYYTSDARLKENVTIISSPIEKLEQIRGVYFDWTDEHVQERGGEDGYFVRKHDIGVIAQEVEAVLPEIVATRDNGYKAVKYEKIVPLLIECIKEQQTQINQILERLEKLADK